MNKNSRLVAIKHAFGALLSVVLLVGCATAKYSALEKFGVHKRDILVGNVEDTRDAQKEAQEQFQDALERFGTLVRIEDTDLKKAYNRLKDEYEDSVDAAEDVSDEIDDVEQVANDLFKEWKGEIKQITDPSKRRRSQNILIDTQDRYDAMLATMKRAERSMTPVLANMKDNVLFLKHNLNAQAIGSLDSSFTDLQTDIRELVIRMNQSIKQSDEFIRDMK